jgi:hypothetical protein
MLRDRPAAWSHSTSPRFHVEQPACHGGPERQQDPRGTTGMPRRSRAAAGSRWNDRRASGQSGRIHVEQPACHGGPERRQDPRGTTGVPPRSRAAAGPTWNNRRATAVESGGRFHVEQRACGAGSSDGRSSGRSGTATRGNSRQLVLRHGAARRRRALRAVAPCWAAASPGPTARFHVEHAVGRQSTRREVPRGTPPRRRVAARPLVGATRHGPSARQDPDRQLLRPRAATRRRWLQDMLLGGRPPSLAPRFPGFHVEHPSGSDADGRRRRSGFQVEHPACGAGSQVGGSS